MLRMAIIGIGMGGSYGAQLHASSKVEFAAMCARTPEKLAQRLETYKAEIGASPAVYTSIDEMLENEQLDGVIISTPSSTHADIACRCAEAGVHMLIDKPADISSEKIEHIRAAVEKSGVLCGVNYPQRLKPVNAGIRKVLEEGRLGRLLLCDFRMKWYRPQEYYDAGGWRGTWEFDGGGSLMNQGAHPMDLLCWFAGAPQRVIGSFGAIAHEIETEDWASAIIEFESGARSTITTTTCVTPKNDTIWFELHGTEGSILLENGAIKFSSIEGLEELVTPPWEHPVEEFIDAVEEKRPPMVSLTEAKRSIDLINAVYESGRSGRAIEL